MKLLKTLAATTALAVAASGAMAQDGKVRISSLTWTGANAIEHIIQAIITGPMGGEAEIVSGASDASVIFSGMDKGDGSLDVYSDLWMPNQAANWDKFVDGNETVAVNTPYTGTQGMFVPHYLADKVTSFEDLNNPEIAALFDKDGNGKGEYWAGDAAWTSTKMWQVKFKSYGLDELWEPEIVSDATFKAQLKAAYGNQKPILFYYWTPEWLFAAYELTALNEPPVTEGCRDLKLGQEDWLEASTFKCKHNDAEVFIAYSKSLETRNPTAAKLLANMKFSPDEVNALILRIGRDEEDPQDVAEEWVEENMDLINSWIQ
ncbi:amino acid-binding protein [Amylibacter marinus]|uniref:Amino acid-binding protein n=1 Tax=Amylibacter marinus TaxID=1475483 RepID=A0ABQ5VT50_9RHOB|nr:glycine betaine ABC transporter substrate-binding protein [Amylibacter marinus]GLQ34288.1 amino acid-binding protein [Amylibacter marinus]